MRALWFSSRPRSFWLGLVAAAVSLALVATWGLTWNRNGWRGDFPRYATIHRGNLMLLSTLWRTGNNRVAAWESKGWIYTASIFFPNNRWQPAYVFVGNAYSGTPAFVAKLNAISLPLWYFAVPTSIAAFLWLRRPANWRGPGQCAACAYDLAGTAREICPECGKEASTPARNSNLATL